MEAGKGDGRSNERSDGGRHLAAAIRPQDVTINSAWLQLESSTRAATQLLLSLLLPLTYLQTLRRTGLSIKCSE